MKKFFAFLFVCLLATPALAADRYWDPDLNAANNDLSGNGLGGAGTWDATTAEWWDGVASDIAWTDNNNAIFWGLPGVVTIPASSTRIPSGLVFHIDGYEIAAGGTTSATRGTMNFATAPNIVVDPNVTALITAKLLGAGGLNISGGGTLKLAEPTGVTGAAFGGANGMTGAVNVTSGSVVNAITPGTVLEVIGGGQIGNSSATSPIVLNGGTYRNTDPTPTGSSFQFTTSTSRPFTIGANGGVFDTPTASSIFLNSAAISAATGTTPTLTKIGPGEVRMSGTGAGAVNTFQKLVINEGRFTIGQATTLGVDTMLGAVPTSPLADAVTIDGRNNGAILRFAGGTAAGPAVTTNVNRGITLGTTYGGTNTLQVGDANAQINGVITGPGGFIKTGTLTLELTNNNTYVGGTTINAGIVKLSNTTGSGVGSGAVTVNSAGNLQINTSTGSQANGGVTLNAGAIISGTGTLSGSLTQNSGSKITPGIGGANAVLTVPTADLSSGNILESTLGASSTSDVLNVTTATTGLTLNGGTISLVPLTTANPAGQTFTLINYNTGYTGTTSSMLLNNLTGFDATLNDDTVNHAIKVTVGSTSIDRTWIRTGDFGLWNNDVPPGPNESANWATSGGVTPASAANGVGSTARFVAKVPAGLPGAGTDIPSQTVTISDFTKVLGSLILDNPNALTFTSGNGSRLNMQTYTGNALIDVKQGTHTINAGMTLASPTDINLADGTTLTLTSTTTANGAVTINTAGTSQMTAAPIANNFGVTKTGTGTLLITTNDWTGTGATNINQGTLRYSSDNAAGLGNSSVITVAAGAFLDFNSNATGVKVSDTIGALAGAGSLINHGNLTLGGVNTTPVTFSGTMGLSAALGGSGNPIAGRIFTKNGSGTQVISGTLESTGNFDANSTVAAGTLLLNNPTGTSLTTSGATLSVSSGATLGGSGYVLGPVTLAAGGNLSPSAPGATTPLGSIGTFHLGAGTLTANGNTTTTVSALKVDLNTTVANGDTSDLIDASGATVNFVTNTNKAKVDLNNAGTMTGGTYTFLKYGTLSTFANLSLGTTPAGFLAKLVNDTTNKQLQVQVEFLGDFNNDNVVDASDYVVWRKNLGLASGASFTQGDANNDGAVTQADYDVWRANFGKSITVAPGSGLGTQAVPEPATVGLLLAAAAFGVFRRRR